MSLRFLKTWMPMVCVGAVLSTCAAVAQSATSQVYSLASLQSQSQPLLKPATDSANGFAGITLEKYPGHFTMLTVRIRSGGAEMHAHFADIFVVVDGEASLLTGGTIVDAKENSDGESSGSSVHGGEQRKLAKGDIVHISANVPHQLLLDPGKVFTYFVVKVQQ
jgi:mannose-6-phosphate isomerase-like protein (cupin superfamily)